MNQTRMTQPAYLWGGGALVLLLIALGILWSAFGDMMYRWSFEPVVEAYTSMPSKSGSVYKLSRDGLEEYQDAEDIARVWLCMAADDMGDEDNLDSAAAALEEITPDNPWLKIARGLKNLRRADNPEIEAGKRANHLKEGVDRLRDVADGYPEIVESGVYLGTAYTQRALRLTGEERTAEAREAMRIFKQVAVSDGMSLGGMLTFYHNRSVAHLLLGQTTESMMDAKVCLGLAPSSPRAVQLMNLVVRAYLIDPAIDIETRKSRIIDVISMIDVDRFQKSKKNRRKMVSRWGLTETKGEIYYLLGHASLKCKDPERALNLFLKAISEKGNAPLPAIWLMGLGVSAAEHVKKTQVAGTKPDKAILKGAATALAKAVRSTSLPDEERFAGLHIAGCLFLWAGDPRLATGIFTQAKRALKGKEPPAEFFRHQGIVRELLGQNRKAIASYQNAIDLWGYNHPLYGELTAKVRYLEDK